MPAIAFVSDTGSGVAFVFDDWGSAVRGLDGIWRSPAPASKVGDFMDEYTTAAGADALALSKEARIATLEFPPGVEFFDVEGIPVTLGNVPGVKFSCAAWDKAEPRVFDPVSARRNGAPVSKAQFLALSYGWITARVLTNGELQKEPSSEFFEFLPRTEFFDVEGTPVTIAAGNCVPYCAAWDEDPPRKFDPESVRRNGAHISEQQFRELVDRYKAVSQEGLKEKDNSMKRADLQRAIEIAVSAHKDQIDKAGSPYILHPIRVMMALCTEEERIVGVLHDVVEDTDWSLKLLREEGFSEIVLDALESVTIMHGENYEDFIKRASRNKIGRKVKIADLHDNMDFKRIAKPTERDFERLKKYAEALNLLQRVEKST